MIKKFTLENLIVRTYIPARTEGSLIPSLTLCPKEPDFSEYYWGANEGMVVLYSTLHKKDSRNVILLIKCIEFMKWRRAMAGFERKEGEIGRKLKRLQLSFSRCRGHLGIYALVVGERHCTLGPTGSLAANLRKYQPNNRA